MRFSSFATAVAAFTTTTSAFLIPPDYVLHPAQKSHPADKSRLHTIHKTQLPPSKEAHSIASLFNLPSAWQVDLPCPDCTWEGLSPTEKQPETVIEVSIDADGKNGLLINNVASISPHHKGVPKNVGLVAKQRRLDTGERSTDLPLDFVLERLLPVKHSQELWGVIITPVRFTIVGLDSNPVKVDTLAIDVVQSKEGWRVGRVSRVPFAKTPGAESCEGQTAWSYCRVKAIIQSRVLETIAGLRAKGKHAKAWASHGCSGGARHHGHRHPHRHWRAHHWAKTLHSTLRWFVIPALLGVIGGLLASAVGMLVGQTIVLLWARFGRNHRRRNAVVHGPVVEIIYTEDEKNRLLLEIEEELPLPPPRYEDV